MIQKRELRGELSDYRKELMGVKEYEREGGITSLSIYYTISDNQVVSGL